MQYHGNGSARHSALSKQKQSFLPFWFGDAQEVLQTSRRNAELCAHQNKLPRAERNAAQQPLSPKRSSFVSSGNATAMHPAHMGSLTQACSRLLITRIVRVCCPVKHSRAVCSLHNFALLLRNWTTDFQTKLFQKHREIQRQSTFNTTLLISQRKKKGNWANVCQAC